MRLINKLSSAVLLMGATLAASGQVSTWKIDPVHSGVEFKVRHLGVSNVHGTFSKPSGIIKLDEKDMTKSSVEASVNTSTVNTNEEARDKHLQTAEFFDVQKYPTITFKSTSVASSGGKLTLTGDLTMNGVTKPVTLALDGPAPPQTDAKGLVRSGFSATGTFHRTDFNFGSKYGPAMIGNDVQFTIDVEMDKQ